jgi:hypothetical protein
MDRQGATIGTLDASGDIADSFVERDVTELDESSVNPAILTMSSPFKVWRVRTQEQSTVYSEAS